MLAEQPIDMMLTATDLQAAKQFYGERIGLQVVIESDEFVTFRCGGDSRLVVTRTSVPSTEQQTKANWRWPGNWLAAVMMPSRKHSWDGS